ncbi:thermonuclease family protein [Nocardioides sp. Root190]|uniref:thermonuclease family protein n=1 Tax=Nocardioides sp. Root190 TaxID=1736488 RepID=UPI0009E8948F|nr:thermonuclease family protein [Nocardioides sp. Root190]
MATSRGAAVALALGALLLAACGTGSTDGPTDGRTDGDAATTVVTETVTATPTTAEPEPVAEVETYVVTRVVDGDTVDLDNGESVRLLGIDTPERGECGFGPAESALKRLVQGKEVVLSGGDTDRDRYDRLLRYLDLDGVDAGLRMLQAGLAIARYDSRDGYGRHPREDAYIAADDAADDVTCPRSEPTPSQEPRGFADTGTKGDKGGNCEPGYDPCVPSYPPDLDCADVGPVSVTGSDPHGLDRDGDGRACGGD